MGGGMEGYRPSIVLGVAVPWNTSELDCLRLTV